MNKLLYAAAVLALLTGPMAMAQIGNTAGAGVGGTFDPTVNAQVDRSVNAGVAGRGGAGSRAQSHPSASSWAPTRSAAAAEQAGANKPGATARAGENERASNSQEENTSGTKKETPKPGTMKKIGAAPTGASSFGTASKGSNQFAFNGRMNAAGGSNSAERERSKEKSFEKNVAGHRGSAAMHRRRRGREFMPKLSPLPHGASDCKDASSLQMCTWL